MCLREGGKKFCISQAVALIRPDHSKVFAEYLWGYINSDRIQQKISQMDKGAGYATPPNY